ncbi:hydroxymethylglutaryl-CoA synthase family protein [Bacillus sp. FJAT-26377]|nr:3-hydroxy-3-methylglutaryl-ACP synthase [Bacillus sp. FJAT-26377]
MNDFRVGIEAVNLYAGAAFIDVKSIFKLRGLEIGRFDNLMMEKKSLNLPCEDSVTNGVNAAKGIINRLSKEDKEQIEMVITASESGIDFGKSISTYIHEYLGLSRKCRLFEVKQACYGGTAALQMACSYVAAHREFNPKVLVIATDIAKSAKNFINAEPSQGAGAVALLVSTQPDILEIDLGAAGMYSYEVMDTCRPIINEEIGDSDLSLYSYLNCLENSFKAYCEKVEDVKFEQTFDYLIYHSPFAGMVKGAHRKMMRNYSAYDAGKIAIDFENRVFPSLDYSMQVGNLYSASLYMALVSLINNTNIETTKRVGLFSYGSGCSSEFFSGLISPKSKLHLSYINIPVELSRRYELNVQEYEEILRLNEEVGFGLKDKEVDMSSYADIYNSFFKGKDLLVLKKIKNYHREYAWS